MQDKIVVIGMGFIGGYLMPGYRALLGEEVAQRVFAIKATERNLTALRAEYPFSISVMDTAEVLEREHPSIIILSPPPTQVPSITEEILKPYYHRCRQAGLPLPDLYTFAPDPDAAYFTAHLGADVNCAKVLPNIVDFVGSIQMAPIGTNFVSVDPLREWPREARERLERFLAPYGETIFLSDSDSLKLLAVKITSHLCYEISFSIADVMEKRGKQVTLAQIGSGIRAMHRELAGEPYAELYPCTLEALPEELRPFLCRVITAWYNGIRAYTDSLKFTISKKEAHHINTLSFELNVMPIQLETREKLRENTRNHGTKGGVLERGCIFYERYLQQPMEQAVSDFLDGTLEEDFYDFVQGMAYTISWAAYRHSRRLSAQ